MLDVLFFWHNLHLQIGSSKKRMKNLFEKNSSFFPSKISPVKISKKKYQQVLKELKIINTTAWAKAQKGIGFLVGVQSWTPTYQPTTSKVKGFCSEWFLQANFTSLWVGNKIIKNWSRKLILEFFLVSCWKQFEATNGKTWEHRMSLSTQKQLPMVHEPP